MSAVSEQQQYELMYEKVPLGLAVVDTHGILIWQNELARQLLGEKTEPGRTILNSNQWRRFRDLLHNNKPFYFLLEDQGFMFIPQQMEIEQQVRVAIWFFPSMSMDMDLVAMQEDLIRQRKLANLGRMMSEMAHELNNPLAGISMAEQLIGMSLKKLKQLTKATTITPQALDPLVRQIEQELQKITHSTNKAAALRQDLLAYSKPQPLVLRLYRVSQLLDQFLNHFLSLSIFKQMTFKQELCSQSLTIACDALKMEQIFYNLFKNAHDAMEGKGTIWVRNYLDGKTVVIEVEDNGPGIAPDMLDKIFSPFHTTKPRTGNGLGLSISQQIIQDHGGTFSVYNKSGSGACFQIRLPAQKAVRVKKQPVLDSE